MAVFAVLKKSRSRKENEHLGEVIFVDSRGRKTYTILWALLSECQEALYRMCNDPEIGKLTIAVAASRLAVSG